MALWWLSKWHENRFYQNTSGDIFDSPEVEGQKEDDGDEDTDEGGRVDEAAHQVDEEGRRAKEDVEEGDEGVWEPAFHRSETFVLEIHISKVFTY